MKHCIGAWMIGLVLASATIPALGQSKDPAAADALFRQGREAMRKGDYAAACPKLAESQRLDPAAGTVLNLAQCEEKIGKFASSYQHYQEAAEQIPADDPRNKVAKDGLDSTRKRVPKLTVKLPGDAPQGTKVLRDDVELGTASLGTPLPVDPGEHVVITRAPGRKEHKESVSLREAESKEITAGIGDPSDESSEPATQRAEPPGSSREKRDTVPGQDGGSSDTLRTLGYVAGAVGLVSLGVGGFLTWKAGDLNDKQAKDPEHFDPNPPYTKDAPACDSYCYKKTQESRTYSMAGYGTLIGGGALVVGGLLMILLSPPGKKEASQPSTTVSFAVGPALAGIQMGGTW